MPIRRLPNHLIHHIAAGEVVDRPRSVVKELIENALDAGATRIEIELEKAGLQLIKVSDNGQGIHQDEAELIFERYATSKLQQLSDFSALETLGFRGEALFSIMTAGNVSLTTRQALSEVGTLIRTFQGKVEEIQPIGHKTGSTVIVQDLFHRFPVRRKSFEPKKELREIQQLVHGFAIMHPSVAFRVMHQGRTLFSSYEHEQTLDRLEKIWKVPRSEWVAFKHPLPTGTLSGWLAKPESFAPHSHHQLISLNSRMISAPEIHHALIQGLGTFQYKGKFPRSFLQLQLDPHTLDVNIHPQKTTVQILNQTEILHEISQAVRSAMFQSAGDLSYRGSQLFPLQEIETRVRDTASIHILSDVLQIDHTYLVAHTDRGILLVDQHAADEKLWYNRLRENEKLQEKLSLQLSEAAKTELADDIYQHSFPENVESRIATIACHTAIRAGQPLSQAEMKQLIEKIIAGGTNTVTCPHGRPTFITLSLGQLSQVFRRS